MSAIERPTIRTDIRQITVRLEPLLHSVMACLAQALQLAGAERGQVTSVGLNVVDSIGQRHLAHGATQSTERLSVELHETTSLPPSRAVQATMFGARCHSICVPLSEDCR
jgi:hypothetical protein